MSGVSIRVHVAGIAEVETALARLSTFQASTLLEALARLIRESARERLISGGPAPDGAAWAPNKEGRTPILHRTGALARSIDYRVAGDQAIVGSGLVYAAIHQFGGTIVPKSKPALVFRIGGRLVRTKKVTMPARPYIGLSADDRSEVVAATVGYLRKLFQ